MTDEGDRSPGDSPEDAREGGAGTPGGEDASTLEERLRRLEAIVRALESEEPELERSLALFEEGVRHIREAEKLLSTAELRVEELVGEEGETRTRPFDEAEE